MSKLSELIQKFKSELGADFISTDVVGMDGLSIGGESIDPNFNGADASARFSMVMKLAAKAAGKLGIGKWMITWQLLTKPILSPDLSATARTIGVWRSPGMRPWDLCVWS